MYLGEKVHRLSKNTTRIKRIALITLKHANDVLAVVNTLYFTREEIKLLLLIYWDVSLQKIQIVHR